MSPTVNWKRGWWKTAAALPALLIMLACASGQTGKPRGAGSSCAGFPPVAMVSGVSVYTDAAHSVPSAALEQANEQKLGNVKQFMWCLEKTLDDPRSSPERLRDAYAGLLDWARAGALLTPPTDTAGRVTRVFMAAGFGIIELKFRARGMPLDPVAADWLSSLAAAVRDDYRNFETNVYPWAGAASALAALVHKDPSAYAFQDEAWRTELARVSADGTLQAEVARGQRALIYHQLAASGLLVLHRARLSLGIQDDPATSSELQRLLGQIGHSLCDPSHMASVAGKQQEMPGSWGFRIARGLHDDLLPADWLRCSPQKPDYNAVDYGGDTRFALTAIEAAALR
jgi:poly(beta-D-mannuronate) lyase